MGFDTGVVRVIAGEKLIVLWRAEKLSDSKIREFEEKIREEGSACDSCEIKEACIERKLGERLCKGVGK